MPYYNIYLYLSLKLKILRHMLPVATIQSVVIIIHQLQYWGRSNNHEMTID